MSNLYVDIVKTIEDGTWKDSPYSGNYRTGVSEGSVKLAPFGKNVPQEVQDEIAELQAKLLSGEFFPFEGPIVDQNGVEQIAAGVRLSVGELESTNYLIEGVIGTIPQ